MNNVWSEVKKCVRNAVSSNLKTQIFKNFPSSVLPVHVLESKDMHVFIQKKCKEGQKRAKYLKIWANMYKI